MFDRWLEHLRSVAPAIARLKITFEILSQAATIRSVIFEFWKYSCLALIKCFHLSKKLSKIIRALDQKKIIEKNNTKNHLKLNSTTNNS